MDRLRLAAAALLTACFAAVQACVGSTSDTAPETLARSAVVDDDMTAAVGTCMDLGERDVEAMTARRVGLASAWKMRSSASGVRLAMRLDNQRLRFFFGTGVVSARRIPRSVAYAK